jgi:hypothetical protein
LLAATFSRKVCCLATLSAQAAHVALIITKQKVLGLFHSSFPDTSMAVAADGVQVRFYGGVKDVGQGDLKRLEAAIKAGSIDEVYMLIRWNGHTTTHIVSKLCRDRDIPCCLIYPADKVKRKQDWADLSSGSDTDSEA